MNDKKAKNDIENKMIEFLLHYIERLELENKDLRTQIEFLAPLNQREI